MKIVTVRVGRIQGVKGSRIQVKYAKPKKTLEPLNPLILEPFFLPTKWKNNLFFYNVTCLVPAMLG